MVPSTSLLSQSALLYVRGDSFVSGLTFLSLDNMVPGGLARLRLFRGVPDYCTALAAQTGHKPLPLNEIQVEFISKACIRLHPKHYSKRCIHVLYVWMHVCMHTCMHACIYLLLYACMYAVMYITSMGGRCFCNVHCVAVSCPDLQPMWPPPPARPRQALPCDPGARGRLYRLKKGGSTSRLA